MSVRNFKCDEELWREFQNQTDNASAELREFIRDYIGEDSLDDPEYLEDRIMELDADIAKQKTVIREEEKKLENLQGRKERLQNRLEEVREEMEKQRKTAEQKRDAWVAEKQQKIAKLENEIQDIGSEEEIAQAYRDRMDERGTDYTEEHVEQHVEREQRKKQKLQEQLQELKEEKQNPPALEEFQVEEVEA